MSVRWALIVGLCALAAFGGKLAYQRSLLNEERGEVVVSRLDQWVPHLYRAGKRGKVTFSQHEGHRIVWHPPMQQAARTQPQPQSGAVTYGFSGGRLGDNLLSYLHARWIAYRDHLHFVFQPFPMADEFALAQENSVVAEKEVVEIPYFPEPSMKNRDHPFVVDWDDPGFREEIARCLAPTKPHVLLELPKDKITVGVHVRRAGRFDAIALHREYPLKFPPDSYYLEQIQRIARIFEGQPLYVFLLTDDLQPQAMLERYKAALPFANIEWGCRERAPDNDLDDFFSIPLFDCLVLCDSNFSIVASKLAHYKVRIAPTHYWRKKERVGVSGVEIVFNPSALPPTPSPTNVQTK